MADRFDDGSILSWLYGCRRTIGTVVANFFCCFMTVHHCSFFRWFIPVALLAGFFAPSARAADAWFDRAWQFRRPVKVIWDDQRATGSELCQVEFFTAGHTLKDAGDVRIATDDGRPIPFELLSVGPGDTARIVFQLVRGKRNYDVYFGNPAPAPMSESLPELQYESGLLMETRVYNGASANNAQQIKAAFDSSTEVLGKIMIERPFIGYNPFGDQDRIISRLSGSIFAPMDGSYTFAQATDDRGALFIDDKPLVYSQLGPPDTRYNGTISLTRGRHKFTFYHINFAGPGWLTVGWKRPDSQEFAPILRDSIGAFFTGTPGPLEEFRKPMTADFSLAYKGEFFFADRYLHRYEFTAADIRPRAVYQWDFGDGQTAQGEKVNHVYLDDGIYPIRLTMTIGGNSDEQTTRMMVRRDFEHITNPPSDSAQDQSTVVSSYNLAKISAAQLPVALELHLRAKNLDAAARVAHELAIRPKHPRINDALAALDHFTDTQMQSHQVQAALTPWQDVPPTSNLQPFAAIKLAELYLWQLGDAARAVAVLDPLTAHKNEPALQRIYGQALILAQRAVDGQKILREVKSTSKEDHQAVLSGALARTIEYYLSIKDPESGEQQWQRWQESYPADFLEGYSLFLRVQLMAMRGNNAPAAQIAADFATAIPDSAYAPRLLDFAWRQLQPTDPQKSRQLHELLKQKYPEDPLAQ